MAINSDNQEVIAIDVGTKRVGVARANTIARIPEPLAVLSAETAIPEIIELVRANHATVIVVGLPRDMKLQETEQTRFTRQWAAQLQQQTDTPLVWQDEAVTSELATQYVQQHKLAPSMLDAVAACIILEDYLLAHHAASKE